MDAGLYKPEYTAVELPLVRDIVFSANQKARRSFYFEGRDEVYLVGGQPNPELNILNRNLNTAPDNFT